MATHNKPEIHPVLLRKINIVLAAMEVAGMPMRIVGGVRTAQEQYALWQIGREKPGKIVTKADGFKTKSNHQPKEDGFGHAVDCAFVVDGQVTWKVPDDWWLAYGYLCKSVGLHWGIKIDGWIDRPHAELKHSI